jgi:uncharacterized membrane protein YccC
MNQLAKMFELNRKGLNVPRGVAVVVVLFVPIIVLGALNLQRYAISLTFGLVLVALADPGGEYANRVRGMAGVGVIGALVTALGFGIGGGDWGFVVLAAFVITLAGGLTVKFGLHRFVAGVMLNIWFVVAISLPAIYQMDRIKTHAWNQALAWLIGSAVWIAFTWIVWLARGRGSQASHFPELPGDTSPVTLTRPLILFAVIRALALSIAVAIAFGLHLPNADWMPIATLVAMKPSLEQSRLVAEQRLVGTILGAALAALFLLTVHSKAVLDVVIVFFAALGISIRGVNYTLYTAAIAAFVLIAMDLSHPTNFGAEGRRMLFTLAGVGIAVIVMLLANLLQQRSSTPPPSPAA